MMIDLLLAKGVLIRSGQGGTVGNEHIGTNPRDWRHAIDWRSQRRHLPDGRDRSVVDRIDQLVTQRLPRHSFFDEPQNEV